MIVFKAGLLSRTAPARTQRGSGQAVASVSGEAHDQERTVAEKTAQEQEGNSRPENSTVWCSRLWVGDSVCPRAFVTERSMNPSGSFVCCTRRRGENRCPFCVHGDETTTPPFCTTSPFPGSCSLTRTQQYSAFYDRSRLRTAPVSSHGRRHIRGELDMECVAGGGSQS